MNLIAKVVVLSKPKRRIEKNRVEAEDLSKPK